VSHLEIDGAKRISQQLFCYYGCGMEVFKIFRGYLSCLLCVAVALMPPATEKKKEKRTEFGTGIESGHAIAEYHDTCIGLRVFFISGEFFTYLRHVDTPSGREFRDKDTAYVSFPDKLIVDVEATAWRCSGNRPLDPNFESRLLNALTFHVNWRIGSESQPAKIISTQVRHQSPSIGTDYFLEVSSKDVPLTARLAMDVIGRDHISLAHIFADLKSL
jgi:hypothetical protein